MEPPRHLFLFTPEALRKTVESAGLQVWEVKHNSVSADFFWTASCASQKGLDPHRIPNLPARLNGCLFMALEHLVTGWPFHRAWGEQLVLMAVKHGSCDV